MIVNNNIYRIGYSLALTAMLNEAQYVSYRTAKFLSTDLDYQQQCMAWAIMFLLTGYDTTMWEFESLKSEQDILCLIEKLEVPKLLVDSFKEKQKAIQSFMKMYNDRFFKFLRNNHIYFKVLKDSISWPEGQLEVFFESYNYKYLHIKLNLDKMTVSFLRSKKKFLTYIPLLEFVEEKVRKKLL